jgi:hypothetical protein
MKNKPTCRPSVEKIVQLPDGESFVGMCVHKGIVVIASNLHVYTLNDDSKLEMVEFIQEES